MYEPRVFLEESPWLCLSDVMLDSVFFFLGGGGLGCRPQVGFRIQGLWICAGFRLKWR